MKRRVSDMPVPDDDVQYGQTGRGAFSPRRRRGVGEVGSARENRISTLVRQRAEPMAAPIGRR
jgi:hypothetical protein